MSPREHRRDAAIVIVVALVVRIVVALWAGDAFPPIADGGFYHTLATRLADGAGYTWLWPDGAVTYAAHYPVGYPAMIAVAYRVFGAGVTRAIAVNALIGTLASGAAWGLARRATSSRWALGAGLAAAVEPAIALYLPAVMTEAVTAHVVVIAAWLVAGARERTGAAAWRWLALAGLAVGVATLIRPQSLLLAPLLGLVAFAPSAGLRQRLAGGVVMTVLALATCAPWTARNCVRMKQCSLVSVNGGWNLLIGIGPNANGHWAPVDVPEACKTVWDEAGKDACFAREARAAIAREPGRFLSLVPKKLAATFDYGGAAPWYLHDSGKEAAFSLRAKEIAGALETVFHRVALALALLGVGVVTGPRARARAVLAVAASVVSVGGLLLVTQKLGWVATMALPVLVGMLGRGALGLPVLPLAAAAATLATAAVHAVFFGAGRYGLVVYPLVTLTAGWGASELLAAIRSRRRLGF